MWSEFRTKLRAIETSLLEKGRFLSKSDAISLSCEDFRLTTPPGLARLECILNDILNTSYIEQQKVLVDLKNESQYCSHILQTQSLRELRLDDHEESDAPHNIDETNQSQKNFDDVSNDYAVPSIDSYRQMVILSKHSRRRLQDTHDALIDILDAKLVAHEVINNSLIGYSRLLAQLALSMNISDAAIKIDLIMKSHVSTLVTHRFLDTLETQDLLNSVKKLWADTYLRSNITLAERSLLSRSDPTENWIRSMMMGGGCTLLLWAFSECFNNEKTGSKIWMDPTFAIFMCVGDLLLLLWMWGLSMQVWRKTGIDFIRLFHLEGTELENLRIPEQCVYSSATELTVVFLVTFICFNKAVRGVFDWPGSLSVAHALPVIMIVYFIYRLVYPTETRHRWFFILYQTLAAPFYPVIFRDGYVGDLLTSLVRVLIAMFFSLAYVMMSTLAWLSNDIQATESTSNHWWQQIEGSSAYKRGLVPFLTLLPLWLRLMQCLRRCVETGKRWPHLGNAAKYTSAIAVISFGTFSPSYRQEPLWVLFFVFATLFQFTWDLTMDWGIVVFASSSKASPTHTFCGLAIRKNRLLGPLWVYTTVIISNLFMRFAWTLTLLPADLETDVFLYKILLDHLGPLIAAGEIMRRMVWGFFRVEYEQLEVLGCPDETIIKASNPSDSFDKMDIASNMHSKKDDEDDAGGSIHVGYSFWDMDIFLLFPWLLTCAGSVGGFCGLHSGSSNSSKARFVECVLFASIVIGIIAAAASS